jgi:uncharacterized membrane protein
MKTVRLLGHPIHQMLIVFPLGLLATAAIFDIIYLSTGNMAWNTVSMYMIAAGIIGGLIAAVFGAIDWWNIPDATRAKRVGAVHGIGNVIVVLLFAASFYIRNEYVVPPTLAYVLSFAAVGIALVTGWLGGELIVRLGVGVDSGANVDAPSSLTTPFASTRMTDRDIRRDDDIRRAG